MLTFLILTNNCFRTIGVATCSDSPKYPAGKIFYQANVKTKSKILKYLWQCTIAYETRVLR